MTNIMEIADELIKEGRFFGEQLQADIQHLLGMPDNVEVLAQRYHGDCCWHYGDIFVFFHHGFLRMICRNGNGQIETLFQVKK